MHTAGIFLTACTIAIRQLLVCIITNAMMQTVTIFLFPVDAMKLVYKAIFLKKLQILLSKDLLQTQGMALEKQMRQARFKKWQVYAKSPFCSVASVVEYLGRYTRKVAISNHRITAVDAEEVSFTYKDYRDGGSTKTMTLRNEDFTKRFVQHILPHRFVRIRHYGILSSS